MRIFLALLLSLLCVRAAHRIGNEAALNIPASAEWSSLVNVRPGHGETVSNNPPIFSWFYSSISNRVGGEQNSGSGHSSQWTNSFVFQVASNSAFTGNLQADVTTFHNFYNFIGPFDTNATRQFWWRIKYVRSGTPYWTNGPYNFTVTATATNWDRSMFASTNYLATNGVHPVLAFRAGEQAAVHGWQTNQSDFLAVSNAAVACTNAAYFKGTLAPQIGFTMWGTNATSDPTSATPIPADGLTRFSSLGAVLNLWALSGDNRWTNASMTGWLFTNLWHASIWFTHPSNNYPYHDPGFGGGYNDLPLLMAAAYDWTYNYLGSDTATFNGQLRTQLLASVRAVCQVQTWYYSIYANTNNGANGQGRVDYDFSGDAKSVLPQSFTKLPHSHLTAIAVGQFPCALVAQADDAMGRMAFDWMLNFSFARTTPYSGFAAHHQGPYGYSAQTAFKNNTTGGLLQFLMQLDVSYPQAQIYRTEFLQRFPSWWTRMNPYRSRKLHGPWGDGSSISDGYFAGILGQEYVGLDMARVARSGAAMQGYNLNAVGGYQRNAWCELPARYHYSNIVATLTPATNSTSAVFVEDGYVTASALSVGEFGAYTNNVGFTMVARPRGDIGGHSVPTDGSLDLWAYGAQLTDGGGSGLHAYDYYSESSSALLIGKDMIGQIGPGYLVSPVMPIACSINAFTNSGTNFVYASAELTGLYTNYYSYVSQSNVFTSVKRHVLFPRSKYFVIYDEFRARSNTHFGFRWHVPWVYRQEASSSALANEFPLGSNLYCSNSFALTTNGFTYAAGNVTGNGSFGINMSFTDAPLRIPTFVWWGNDTNQVGLFSASGIDNMNESHNGNAIPSDTNSTLNPFRGSGGTTYAQADFAAWGFDRAVGLFVTNRVATTNFALLTVIVPQGPGKSAPTFERLADNAVVVTYDGVPETIVFGANYAGAYTYMVDLAGNSSSPVSTIRGATIRAGTLR